MLSLLTPGFSLEQKAMFFRQLATMVASAMPLGHAVQTAGATTKPRLCKYLAARIDAGESLHQAMQAFPSYFTPLEINVVRTGEVSGNLDNQLLELAESLERTWKLQTEITGRLIYPILILHGAVIIPPIALIVEKGIAAYISLVLSILIPVYLLAIVSILIYSNLSKTSAFRYFIDKITSILPFVGPALTTLASSRFLRALSVLYTSGISPDHAIDMAADSSGNSLVTQAILKAHKRTGEGELLSHTLAASGLFPPAVIGLVTSGEEAGRTEEVIGRAATLLEDDAIHKIKKMMAVIPVLLLLVVGTIVGVIVIKHYLDIMRQLFNV